MYHIALDGCPHLLEAGNARRFARAQGFPQQSMIAHGSYQIGEVTARSRVVIGTSLPIFTLNRTVS
jgi:hypothetical protein